MRRTVVSEKLSSPVAEYSQSARSGRWVFVGAKGGTSPVRSVPFTGTRDLSVREQLRIAMENLRVAGEELGGKDLRQVTVFITDWRNRETIDSELDVILGPVKPAVTWQYAPAFAHPELLVEVDGIFEVPSSSAPVQTYRFSDDLGAPGRGLSEELEDLEGRINSYLSVHGLVPANIARMRVTCRSYAHVNAVHEWLQGTEFLDAVIDFSVAPLADPLQRVQASLVCCDGELWRTPPEEDRVGAALVATQELIFTASCAARTLDDYTYSGQMEEILARVRTMGSGLEDVVKVEGVLRDWRLYQEFRTAYADTFQAPYPTRALVQSANPSAPEWIQTSWILGKTNDSEFLVVNKERNNSEQD